MPGGRAASRRVSSDSSETCSPALVTRGPRRARAPRQSVGRHRAPCAPRRSASPMRRRSSCRSRRARGAARGPSAGRGPRPGRPASTMPSGRRWSVAGRKPVHQTTASTGSRRAVAPDDAVRGETLERSHRVQNAAVPRLLHRRHHHDVAERGGRGFAEVAADPGARPFEEDAAVDVVGQEHRVVERHPGGVGDLAQLGEDLGAGIAAADHEHALSREGLRAAVVGRVELDAAEVLRGRDTSGA